jgi:hypothetical protein
VDRRAHRRPVAREAQRTAREPPGDQHRDAERGQRDRPARQHVGLELGVREVDVVGERGQHPQHRAQRPGANRVRGPVGAPLDRGTGRDRGDDGKDDRDHGGQG